MATVTVALLLLLTVDAIAVTAVDCCWLLMLLLLLLLTTPERDSFKIDDPSRVFSTTERDPSTLHTFVRPQNGVVSKLTTHRAFFRQQNGILRPLARSFSTPEWERVQSANFTVASTLTSDSLLTVYMHTIVFVYHTQCPTIPALSHRRSPSPTGWSLCVF